MVRNYTIASRQLDQIFERMFYCLACTNWRLARSLNAAAPQTRTHRRHQSTWGSSTAINGTHPTPPKFKALHEALVDVRKKASPYLNQSRLHLAIQSLESNRPTIRLAVLGLDVPDTARQLARLLLADALENEGAWERQLADGLQDFSRGLIIRYANGSNPNIPRPRTSVPVLHVPSTILEKNNIEILVSSVNGPSHDGILQTKVQTPSDAFLSPMIGTPTSESGRQVAINQPAHRCLLVAKGLDQLIAVAQLLAATKFASVEDRDSITVAVNIEGIVLTNPDRATLVMDTRKAEEGLAAIRKSVTYATDYEHKWIDSGMPAISKWLSMAAAAQNGNSGQISRPVRDLISSLLTAATSNLQAAALASSKASASQGLSLATKTSLEEAIELFSRSSHQELQSGLASAWKSRNWRKLAWYKLFWRVDDVGLIITDLVGNAWLPRTERAVYELSGRLVQIGISPVSQSAVPLPIEAGQAFEPASTQEVSALQPDAHLATTAIQSQPTEQVIVNQVGKSDIQVRPVPQPIPIAMSISQARNSYMSDAITLLTTTAQQLVLRTLSIAGLSAGLSGLTYFSLFSSVYEAGTIAAIGTIFALWRMQGDWQKATKQLEDGLFDEGRRAIVDIVDRMKILVEQRSLVEEDPNEKNARVQAETAINNAKTELQKLESVTVTVEKK